jgi:hypothetical protein
VSIPRLVLAAQLRSTRLWLTAKSTRAREIWDSLWRRAWVRVMIFAAVFVATWLFASGTAHA